MAHVRSAFYPGSFDPITLGHCDILERCAKVWDRLVVGIGCHHDKAGFYPLDQRLSWVRMVGKALEDSHGVSVDVVVFEGLVVEAVRECGAEVLVRGVRNGGDFEYEYQLAAMNKALAPDVETMFFMASPNVSMISSSLVRQIVKMGGDVSGFVPEQVWGTIRDGGKENV